MNVKQHNTVCEARTWNAERVIELLFAALLGAAVAVTIVLLSGP